MNSCQNSSTSASNSARVNARFQAIEAAQFRATDRMFAGLMVFQWLAEVLIACWVSPLTWAGRESETHPHVWIALGLGGAICIVPVIMALRHPGSVLTRHLIAVGQALTSSLLIHLSSGRLETHFHIFGSLAFLAFYRDWRVLMTASAVVAADHFLRGNFWPESVYGTATGGSWRWIEHGGWVVFEDIFLVISIIQSRRAMLNVAEYQVTLETSMENIELKVKERTAELEYSQQLYRSLIEFSPDTIVIESQGVIAFVNPAGARLIGAADAGLIVGKPLRQFMQSDTLQFGDARHPTRLSDVQHPGDPGAGDPPRSARLSEARVMRLDGMLIDVELTGRGLIFEGQWASQIVARDITGRKRAEEERKNLEAQLRQAQKLESVGQLAAGVAHEINTPIQFIGDNTRFLRDAFDDLNRVVCAGNRLLVAAREGRISPELIVDMEEVVRQADTDYLNTEIPNAIQQSADGLERVSRIVRAMKEFSHPGGDQKTAIDINKAIDNTLIVARNEWKYVAEAVTELAPALPLVACLPGEINQVLLNLIVNAAHAISDAGAGEPATMGTITISTRASGNGVEIRVRDTGCGIPEAHRDRVFDPFFTTKPVGKGTGQGLTITHAVIVKKHGGTISFESKVGKGTTFIIWLPLQSA